MSIEQLDRARAALARGDAESARCEAQFACEEAPDSAEAWFLLGAAHHGAGDLGAALSAFEDAERLVPGTGAIANARASVLSELGRVAEARSVLETALARGCDQDARLYLNLAIALEALDALPEAESRYREAIERAGASRGPASAPALQNLGALLMRCGRHADALVVHEALVAIAPDLADAHFNVAENLLAVGRPEDALAAAERALRLDPRHVFAHVDRAFALALVDRLPAAQAALEYARAIDPARFSSYRNGFDPLGTGSLEGLDARMLFVHWHTSRLAECDWARYDAFVATLRGLLEDSSGWPVPFAGPSLPFAVFGLPISPELQTRLARDTAVQRQGQATPRRAAMLRRRSRSTRLRIGYVSPDFHAHPLSYLTRNLFREHDRARFEIVAYSLFAGEDDEFTHAIEAGCDAFQRVAAESTERVVERIANDGIDVLVDLAGYTANTRFGIYDARPAPVQVTWLGFAGTTGSAAIDYALVDHVAVPPENETFWSEQLAFLPDSYFCSSPVAVGPTPPRSQLGLPDDAFVFCCFNNAWKIEPVVFARWLRILHAVPASVLWLLGLSNAQVNNLRAAAAAAGVDPDRLIFAPVLPYERHLARVGAADLFLDTFLFNAHTTAVDSLSGGVPVLTCTGATTPARVATSLLHAIGLPELITTDHDSYEATAIGLARDHASIVALRAKLANARKTAPFFQPKDHARNLERAYERMWHRHASGLPPVSFDVRGGRGGASAGDAEN